MHAAGFLAWIDAYERAWRSPGTDQLTALFHPDAVYLMSPYADPFVGLDAITVMWDDEREGPDEAFTMTREAVAVSGDVGVARVDVAYGQPVRQHYRDLWVVQFASDGRAVRFEEWPFWPTHGRTPVRADPVALQAGDVDGAADLEIDGRRHPVRAGTVAYVPAGVDHRFVDITSELRTAVVFAPPEDPDA